MNAAYFISMFCFAFVLFSQTCYTGHRLKLYKSFYATCDHLASMVCLTQL